MTDTPLPPPLPTPETPKGKPWWQRWWAIAGAIVIVLAIVGAVIPNDDDDDNASPATTAAAPATSATEAPVTTAAPALDTEDAANLAWAATASEDAATVTDILDQISTNAQALDESATQQACEELIPAVQQLADNAPDTEAGRHARTASNLFVQGAGACLAGDYDTATTFFVQGGDEIEESTVAMQETVATAS